MKKISVIMLMLITVLCGCTKTFSIKDPVKVTIQSGPDIVEITDEETISALTKQITSIQFKRGESSAKMTGWEYWLKWYDKDGTIIFDAYVAPDGINYNDRYWYCENGTIDTGYYDELIETEQENQ